MRGIGQCNHHVLESIPVNRNATDFNGGVRVLELNGGGVTDTQVPLTMLMGSGDCCLVVMRRLYHPNMDIGRVVLGYQNAQRCFRNNVVLFGDDSDRSCGGKPLKDLMLRLKKELGINRVFVPSDTLADQLVLTHSKYGRRFGLYNGYYVFKNGSLARGWRAPEENPDLDHSVGFNEAFPPIPVVV